MVGMRAATPPLIHALETTLTLTSVFEETPKSELPIRTAELQHDDTTLLARGGQRNEDVEETSSSTTRL
jgi:hypothetical protein